MNKSFVQEATAIYFLRQPIHQQKKKFQNNKREREKNYKT